MSYLRVNRTYTPLKRWGWTLVPLIALGGLFIPKLGLLLIPIMLTLMVLGLFWGKVWCGSYCPHASLFDHLLLPWARLGTIPKTLRSSWLRGLFFAFYMGMFIRRLVVVSTFWGGLDFWDKLGFLFAVNYLMPTLIGISLTFLVNPRAWCSFCPMGTMQSLAYKAGRALGLNRQTEAKITISNLSACRECGKCARACPMQLSPYLGFSPNNQFEDGDCIKCAVCVANCPFKLLSMQKRGEHSRQQTKTA